MGIYHLLFGALGVLIGHGVSKKVKNSVDTDSKLESNIQNGGENKESEIKDKGEKADE